MPVLCVWCCFQDIVRRIKAIAKTDEHCAAGTIRYLMQRMTAKSAEVRFIASLREAGVSANGSHLIDDATVGPTMC